MESYTPTNHVEAGLARLKIEEENRRTEQLAETWARLVCGRAEAPPDIREYDAERTRAWMYESLMEESGRLVDEWGLEPDRGLMDRIARESDPGEKAELEAGYIADIQAGVHDFTRKINPNAPDIGTRWDSWPERMRHNRQFNCVGGSLLGINFLNRAGIDNFLGDPRKQVVNIARLSDGRFLYIDAVNRREPIELKPEFDELDGISVMRVDDPRVDYRLIPLRDKQDIVRSVLGNLKTLKTEGGRLEYCDNLPEEIESSRYCRDNKELLGLDLEAAFTELYPGADKPDNTQEMQAEFYRLDRLEEVKARMRDYFDNLRKDQIENLKTDIKDNLPAIKQYLKELDERALPAAGAELTQLLMNCREGLAEHRQNDPELHRDITGRIYTGLKVYSSTPL